MSRRFYLPPRKPSRPVPNAKSRFGTVPRWLKTTLPIVVGLMAIWYVAGELNLFSFQPAPALRTRVGSAVQPDSEIKPADSLGRPIIEEDDADVSAHEIPETSLPVSDKPIRLQVLNGCGVKGLAKIVSPALRAKGFDVRETRNAGSFRFAKSMVLDRVGILETALAVADSLGMDHSLVKTEIARNLVDIDVTLIVGADYQSLRLSLKN